MTKTLVVDNFKGSFTEFLDGDINSGLTNIINSFGYDSFKSPGNLTWAESPTQIDSAGSVITDLIMSGKARVESGVVYVYAIGHTGRLYKIQVNDPTSYNPNYDNPVLLTTLTVGSPTFTRGGYIDFFGATEKIYIGHDKGVTTVNFNGTGEAAISGTWTQTVPRQLKQFLGKLYVGNGTNIAEIDSTGTQTSAAKLSPAFPINTQVRDMDVNPEGTYLQIIVSQLALSNVISTTADTSIISNLGSWIFYWNGIDTGYTSSTAFPLINLSSNIVFGSSQYVFGSDIRGSMFYDPITRISAAGGTAQFGEPAFSNALFSDGGMFGFATTLYYNGFLELSHCVYGQFDAYVGTGYWSPLGMTATGTETDILHVPYFQVVSNYSSGASSNGYPDNIFGVSKVYFSTLETSSAPTTKYKLYSWSPLSSGLGTATSYCYYQTQTQILSKKVTIKEIRIYGEPWVAGNSFSIDLIGSSGSAMSGGSKTFTAGTNLTIGDDFAWYTPDCAPTYSIGLGVANLGETNHLITKVEIDYDIGGK
jgi:hypothetical protein